MDLGVQGVMMNLNFIMGNRITQRTISNLSSTQVFSFPVQGLLSSLPLVTAYVEVFLI